MRKEMSLTNGHLTNWLFYDIKRVGQKVNSGFSMKMLRKIWINFLANPKYLKSGVWWWGVRAEIGERGDKELENEI